MKQPDLEFWNFVFRDLKSFWRRSKRTVEPLAEETQVLLPVPLDIPWMQVFPEQKSGATTLHTGFWQGKELQFRVRWHEDRVYFGVGRGRLGIYASLDKCNEEEAIACWKQALESKRFGVCRNLHSIFRHGIYMGIHLILCYDGTGLARENWSQNWSFFAPEQTRGWILQPFDTGEESLLGDRFSSDIIPNEDLLLRRVTDEGIQRIPFICNTNEQEFNSVIQFLWNTKFLCIPNKERYGLIQCETSLYRMRGQLTIAHNLEWKGHPEFWKWLQNYFTVEGAQWKKTHYGRRKLRRLRAQEPQMRLFFEPHFVCWRQYFHSTDEPTFHEQLEARLELRDWLRDKASAEQIEAWLASSTQTETR